MSDLSKLFHPHDVAAIDAAAEHGAAAARSTPDLAHLPSSGLKAHQLTDAIFAVLTAGIDAALGKLPLVGPFVAGIINPILDKLEPAVEAKLAALMG